MNNLSTKRKMIEEICAEKQIKIVDISYDWISLLKKGKTEKKLMNNHFYLNSRMSVELAKDKYSTYELLKYHEIPTIKHQILFNPEIIPDVEEINQNYQCLKNDEKQVIKANDSSQGKDVYCKTKQLEKIQIVEKLFQKEIEAVVVCPYQEIEYEYRVLFLYGEVIYIYKKQKPFVLGDGKLNVRELIAKHLKYLIEPIEGLDFDYIPKKAEKVLVGWKHNLSNGAIPILVNEEDIYYQKIKKMALETGKVLDLNFASIDICVTSQQEVYVMEVNSNVCISKFCELVPNGYEIGKKIYSKVIDKMFEEGENNENRN